MFMPYDIVNPDTEAAELALHQVTKALANGGDDIDVTGLPIPVLEFLASILERLAAGIGVAVISNTQELRSAQAAMILGVSTGYLNALLEEDKMPYRRIGRSRFIRVGDLMAYKTRDDAAKAVTQTEQD